MRVDGELGSRTVKVTRWAPPAAVAASEIATSGTHAVAVDHHFAASPPAAQAARWLSALLMPYEVTARLWQLETGSAAAELARSLLDVRCQAGVITGELVCAAFDGSRTRLSAVPAATGRILPLGIVDGRFAPYASHPQTGWLTGWARGAPLAVRLESTEAVVVPRVRGALARAISATDRAIAVVRAADGGSTISIYLRKK